MPWKAVTKMQQRHLFVQLALNETVPFSQLCERFGVSRKTGYKLLSRFNTVGMEGLKDDSRRPHHSPYKTPEPIENEIVTIRKKRPYWGGKKIRAYLMNEGQSNIPSASTITDILRRHSLIKKEDSQKSNAFQRFEHEAPNDLWQADFKGHFAMRTGRCHPLTILDDHSRFSVAIRAFDNERKDTITPAFIDVFEEYGIPWRMNFDNGKPWGNMGLTRYTTFGIWLMRLGIRVSFSRPRHPQTNGKEERFHRSMKNELLNYHYFWDLEEAQKKFNAWREEYNFIRPHESCDMKPPVTRYQLSPRVYPGRLPDIEYRDDDIVLKVNKAGCIGFNGKKHFVGEAFYKLPVGLRQQEEGLFIVYFCDQKVSEIDLRNSKQ